jgi:hypothetical protein
MGGGSVPRARSPQPGWGGSQSRPASRNDMSMQLSRPGSEYGSLRGNGGGPYDAAGVGPVSTRVRSKSVAEARQYSKDGRAILHHGKSKHSIKASMAKLTLQTSSSNVHVSTANSRRVGFRKGRCSCGA